MSIREELQQRSERIAQQFNVLLEQDNAPFRFRESQFSRMNLHIFMPGHDRDQWEILGVSSRNIQDGEEEAYYHSHVQEWQEAYEKRLVEKRSNGAFYGDSSGYNWFGGHHE